MHLGVELEPLFSMATGERIVPFPETLGQLERLDGECAYMQPSDTFFK